MPQSTFSIRMDTALKKEFDELCSDFGMNATTAFNIFARAVVRERKIPFEISSNLRKDAKEAIKKLQHNAIDNGTSDMSIDEINQEIQLVHKEKQLKIWKSIKLIFYKMYSLSTIHFYGKDWKN